MSNYVYDMFDGTFFAFVDPQAAAQKGSCHYGEGTCGCNGETPKPKKEQIPADLFKTDDKLTIQVAVPGKTKDDISVTSEVDSDGLYIVKINVKESEAVEGVKYLRKKIKFVDGELPIRVTNKWDVNKGEVSMENGLLSITIPLAEESKPKKFEIK